MPSNPLGKYLNISSELTNKDQKLHIFSLDIGNIPVPNFISAFFLKLAQEKISSQFIEYQYVINSITDFKFQKQQASINYVWDQKLAHQIKNRIASRVISPVLLNNILAYTKNAQTFPNRSTPIAVLTEINGLFWRTVTAELV